MHTNVFVVLRMLAFIHVRVCAHSYIYHNSIACGFCFSPMLLQIKCVQLRTYWIIGVCCCNSVSIVMVMDNWCVVMVMVMDNR